MVKDLTKIAVNNQLRAMRCKTYDIGLRLDGRKGMMNYNNLGESEIKKRIEWLKAKNREGEHVYIRPHTSNGLILVDDLTQQTINIMQTQGVAPACTIETSPNNFQTWIRISETEIDCALATQIAKNLASRFGADPASADYHHYGRLAGFTNRKPCYVNSNGQYPYTKVNGTRTGRICSEAKSIITEAKESLRNRAQELVIASKTTNLTSTIAQTRKGDPEAEYERQAAIIESRYSPKVDCSRLDWMITRSMLLMGFNQEQISQAMLAHSPNLKNRKGDYAEGYINLTLANATKSLEEALTQTQEHEQITAVKRTHELIP